MGVDFKSNVVTITGNLIVSNILYVGTTIISGNGTTVTNNFTVLNNFSAGTLIGNLLVNNNVIFTPLDYYLKIDGNLQCTGDLYGFSSFSDRRLKSNIKNLQGCLGIVNSLRPVEFYWNDETPNESKKGTRDTGLIAQEVTDIVNEVGGTDGEYCLVKYEKLVPYLIGAIQELSLRLGP